MHKTLTTLAVLLSAAFAQQQDPPTPRPIPPGEPPATVTATRNEPTPLEFTSDQLKKVQVPAGFQVKVISTGLGNARMLQVMPDGSIYLTRRSSGDVLLLKDQNGDGMIDSTERKQVAQNLSQAHGIAEKDGKLYIAADTTIWVASILSDGTLTIPRVFASDFPDGGQHSARTLHWGSDGYLYASIGSPNNDTPVPNPESATLVKISPDGKSREVFARGLRHTIGFGWHPQTGILWGFDQGSDWHGDNIPPEELNRLERGKNYGWPFCYGDRIPDPYVNVGNIPGKITKEEYCKATEASTLNYTAHAAAINMIFYTGTQFPAEFKNDAFVAFRGSWNRNEPSGYELARVHFDAMGVPVSITPFMTGFVFKDGDVWKQFARLAGVAQYTDGSLLVTDDQSGVLLQISYTGGVQ
ncbi:PQQ-dependent sugar dehydrogenase [Deinococcus roseus]|nr:sorbosone dehydrogenase family protein [Deinococcus roseus]